jgi:hypothetical protein
MMLTYSFMLLPIMPEEDAAFLCISIAAAARISPINMNRCQQDISSEHEKAISGLTTY